MDGANGTDEDSKKGRRFQVQRVRYQSTGEDQLQDDHEDQDPSPSSESPPVNDSGPTNGEVNPEQVELEAAGDAQSQRDRHPSSTNTSLNFNDAASPRSSLNSESFRNNKDTRNLKTFGKNTHERIPHLDFYRRTTSVDPDSQYKRPTLEELHEEKVLRTIASLGHRQSNNIILMAESE